MGRISIKDIKPSIYEGYIWMSDKDEPTVYDSTPVTLPLNDSIPFVVEGQLYSRTEGISYSIKYVDGQYIVHEYYVTEADKENPDNQIKTYMSNRMGDKILTFLRYWVEILEKDNYKDNDNPDGLPVLTQTKNVFIGFSNKNRL